MCRSREEDGDRVRSVGFWTKQPEWQVESRFCFDCAFLTGVVSQVLGFRGLNDRTVIAELFLHALQPHQLVQIVTRVELPLQELVEGVDLAASAPALSGEKVA